MRKTRFPTGAIVPMPLPINKSNERLDRGALAELTDFYAWQGVGGLLTLATMGESRTMSQAEQEVYISIVVERAGKSRVPVIVNCGSSSTRDSLRLINMAKSYGIKYVVMLDVLPGQPCSLGLRDEYWVKVLEAFPDMVFGAYAMPGITGTSLSVGDIVWLCQYPHFCALKDGSPNLTERLSAIREGTPNGFVILTAPSRMIFITMTDSEIMADGSVAGPAMFAPGAMQKMCVAIWGDDITEAGDINAAMEPFFTVGAGCKIPRQEIISGRTYNVEDQCGSVSLIKALMRGIGMPVGPCRRPLNKLPLQAVLNIRDAVGKVQDENPEILEPVAKFFSVDIAARLADNDVWNELAA